MKIAEGIDLDPKAFRKQSGVEERFVRLNEAFFADEEGLSKLADLLAKHMKTEVKRKGWPFVVQPPKKSNVPIENAKGYLIAAKPTRAAKGEWNHPLNLYVWAADWVFFWKAEHYSYLPPTRKADTNDDSAGAVAKKIVKQWIDDFEPFIQSVEKGKRLRKFYRGR